MLLRWYLFKGGGLLRLVESAKNAENAVYGATFLVLEGFRGVYKGWVLSFQRL